MRIVTAAPEPRRLLWTVAEAAVAAGRPGEPLRPGVVRWALQEGQLTPVWLGPQLLRVRADELEAWADARAGLAVAS